MKELFSFHPLTPPSHFFFHQQCAARILVSVVVITRVFGTEGGGPVAGCQPAQRKAVTRVPTGRPSHQIWWPLPTTLRIVFNNRTTPRRTIIPSFNPPRHAPILVSNSSIHKFSSRWKHFQIEFHTSTHTQLLLLYRRWQILERYWNVIFLLSLYWYSICFHFEFAARLESKFCFMVEICEWFDKKIWMFGK